MEIHFSNPAAMTSGSDPAQQGRTSALVPECLEEEGSLADPATSEDLFEKLAGAVSDKLISKGTRNDRFSTNPARDWFESVVARQLPKRSDGQPSFEAALDGPTLHDILERGLQLQLDQHQTQLLSKDVGTGSELIEWWDAQSGVDMSSMDPFQIALAALEEGKMISPTSKFRGNWDLAQAIFLMYIAISLPYRLGFKDGVILWSFWFWFDLAIDVYFLLDLFVNFRTAVITKEGALLHEQCDIARHYLKTWFAIDFVSCLPVGYLEYMMDDQETAGSNNKSARLLRLFRLLKLLRLVRIKRIMERWEEELYGNRSIRIGKLIFLIAISSHWSCCGWFFSGDGSDGPPDGRDDGWVQRRFNTSEPADFTDQYFAAFFWSAMAIVKVGLADPIYRPDQDAEKFMTLISFFLGLAITSVIIGQVSDMIAHNNPAEKVRTDQIGIIHGFLHEKKIAPWLTRKIRGHFSNLYAERGTVDNISAWMDSMPRTMREELGVGLGFLHNYKTGRRGMLCKVPFFFELESADVLRIGCRLCAQKYGIQSGESAIMREGERGDEMYVITEGSVRIERYSDEGLADKGLARRASETFDAEVGTGSPRSARATAAAAAAAAAAISTGHEHRRERKNLGLLREFDFFGELCVLARDEDGLHLRRGRSATAASSVCMVHSLSYGALQDLRRQSPTIDAAIRHAVARVRRARPSLFRADSRSSPGGSSPRGGDGGGAEGGRGEGAPLSLQEQFEELARWQRQVASETADRMATLRAAFARSDATRTAERLV